MNTCSRCNRLALILTSTRHRRGPGLCGNCARDRHVLVPVLTRNASWTDRPVSMGRLHMRCQLCLTERKLEMKYYRGGKYTRRENVYYAQGKRISPGPCPGF